jgi:imidazolonepropionase-like amidohydrolase
MNSTLFTNVRVIDGSGTAPFAGDVLIQGNRISRVIRTNGARTESISAMTVIDGAGATLMPGMIEGHTHFAWNNSATLDAIQVMPTEEHVLWAAGVAKTYLDHGWTSCMGAATAKPRLDVVLRNAINEGLIPGPRYLAASQEITVAGSLGDDMLPHLPYQEFSFGQVICGPEEMRKVVRMFLKYGVDNIKLNLSGDNFVMGADAHTTWMSDEEVAMAVKETTLRGKRVVVHARSCASVKQALRHNIDLIYHASFTDSEALDMLEARKDSVFIAPGLSVIVRLLYDGDAYGISRAKAIAMGYEKELAASEKSLREMHKRGIRVLPGGDYGFAWARHGENARDLSYLVKYAGMTPMEAIVATTKFGGQLMMQGHELGIVKEGYLADLVLIDGDPLADLTLLEQKSRFLAIMKDGKFHKAPALRNGGAQMVSSGRSAPHQAAAPTRWSAS